MSSIKFRNVPISQLNGSGQEPRNRHFNWNFKYFRIHPNFASRPVWCVKMFLCCFFLKAGRKDLTNRPKVLSSHPLPPPPPPRFLPCSTGFLISRVSKFSIFQEERSNWGGGGGGEERTSGLFVKSFLPAFRKKQHRNIFSNHTGLLAKFGWILTYLKISVEMAVTWFLPGAIQLDYGCTKYNIMWFWWMSRWCRSAWHSLLCASGTIMLLI